MADDKDQRLDAASAPPDDLGGPVPSERPIPAEPDGDVAFVPGAEVPLPPPPDEVPRCPWCSGRLDDRTAASCPSCGAQLTAGESVEVPGVTAIDPVVLALANRPKPERRSLASWLAGDTVDEYPAPTEEELAALARPDAAVRREMRRLELAAMGIVVEGEAAGPEPAEGAAGAGPAEGAAGAGSADGAAEAAPADEAAAIQPEPPGDDTGTIPEPG